MELESWNGIDAEDLDQYLDEDSIQILDNDMDEDRLKELKILNYLMGMHTISGQSLLKQAIKFTLPSQANRCHPTKSRMFCNHCRTPTQRALKICCKLSERNHLRPRPGNKVTTEVKRVTLQTILPLESCNY